jgi:phosphoglycolate phosphatase
MAKFPFDIVGFDLDGTLLDTHEDLGAAVNHALKLAGRPSVPLADMRNLIGGGAKRMLERALAEDGALPQEEFKPLYKQLLSYYEANIAVHTRLFPGGEAMLDALAAEGTKIAVVTNKFEHFARMVLEQLGLSSRFFTIIGGDTLGPGKAKPEPDLINLMIERAGGGRAAFVGDTTYDIGAAKAAGLPSVAVSFGFNDFPVQDLGADAVIDHFDQLIPALRRL